MNTQFFSKNVIALISLVMMFTFSSCSYEDLSVNDITKECQIQEARLKQQEDAYSKALKKIPSLYGFIIDDYKERGRNGRDVYGDGVSIDRYYTEWDVRFKFPSSLVHLSEAYWNWALFDPNMSFERYYRINKRAPVQFPVMERAYDNISIIQDVKP